MAVLRQIVFRRFARRRGGTSLFEKCEEIDYFHFGLSQPAHDLDGLGIDGFVFLLCPLGQQVRIHAWLVRNGHYKQVYAPPGQLISEGDNRRENVTLITGRVGRPWFDQILHCRPVEEPAITANNCFVTQFLQGHKASGLHTRPYSLGQPTVILEVSLKHPEVSPGRDLDKQFDYLRSLPFQQLYGDLDEAIAANQSQEGYCQKDLSVSVVRHFSPPRTGSTKMNGRYE